MKKYKILEDKTIIISNNMDYLNNSVYVNEMKRVIESTISTSYTETIGLFGAWGSGKSSILKSVSKDFDGSKYSETGERIKNVKFHFYDAWKYSTYDFRETFLFDIASNGMEKNALKEKLYIKTTVSKHSFNKWKTAMIFIFTLILLFIISRFIEFDNIIKEPVDTVVVLVLLTIFEVVMLQISNLIFKESSETSQKTFSQNDYYNEFTKIVKASKKTKIFVIDNLDRCTEEYAIEILDFIKGFLSKETGNYIFIIPIDEGRIIKELINKRNYDEVESKDFLSKVFDVTVVMQSYPRINTYKLAKSLSEINKFGFSNISLNLISQYYGNTPRKIKKIINLINSKREIVESLFDSNNIDYKNNSHLNTITKAVIIREKWPKMYNMIESNPSLFSNLYRELSEKHLMNNLDPVFKRFVNETRDINTRIPIVYISDTYDEFSFSEDDTYLIRTGKIIELIPNIKTDDEINSLTIILKNEFFEYDYNREGLFFKEFFISLNDFFYYLSIKNDQKAIIIDSLISSFRRISLANDDIFDDTFNENLEIHIDKIVYNVMNERNLQKYFINIVDKIIRLKIERLLLKLIIDQFDNLNKIKFGLSVKIFKEYVISSKSSFNSSIEMILEETIEFVDSKLILFLMENSKLKYLGKIYIIDKTKFSPNEDKYIEFLLNTTAEYRSITFANSKDHIDKINSLKNVLIFGSEKEKTLVTTKLTSLGFASDCYRLITQYVDNDESRKFMSSINFLLFELFKASNYNLSSYYLNYINILFDTSNVDKFRLLISNYLNIASDIQIKEKIYITHLLTSNFDNEEFLIKYLIFFDNNSSILNSTFIKSMLIAEDNSVNSTLSFVSKNSNINGILDCLESQIRNFSIDSLSRILTEISINELATNTRIQDLSNFDNRLKRIFIMKAHTYNDLSICANSLEEKGIIRDLNQSLYILIPKMKYPEIILLDKNRKLEVSKKVRTMVKTRVEELNMIPDKSEFERIF